jgi:hypothetical protein
MRRLHLVFIKHKTIILDRLKHSLLVLTILIFHQNSIAQTKSTATELAAIDNKINESVFISPNTNSYLTGETLRYKLFCIDKLNNTATVYSKIAYVELIDPNKKSVFTQKLFLKNGTANGDFFIPTTLETGNYKLIGYTKWMLNKVNPDFFNIDIYIVNPYESNNKTSNNQIQTKKTEERKYTAQDLAAPTNNTNSNLNLEIAKKTYSNRENIDLKIKTNSDEFAKGIYSVSVRKIDGLLSKNKLSFDEYTTANANRKTDNTIDSENLVLPELRGEIISGKIVSKTPGLSVENKNISISIPGKNFEVKISKTDQNGHFLFILDKSSTNSNIIIQLIDADKEKYSIEIDKAKALNYKELIFNTDPVFNTNFNKNIKERAISSQIENAYYNITKDSLIAVKEQKKFYEPVAKDYILDNFNRFSTLKETAVEIVKEMSYTQSHNKYELRLFDYDINFEIKAPPLVIVDGLLIQDMNELFEYKMSNVYKISVSNRGYYYGTKLFSGLISFTTKNFDYVSNLSGSFIIKPEILRPLGKKEYYQPDYTNKDKNSRLPDYRHQLLWLPDLKLDDKEKNISFYTSDINGQFEIILEGFSELGKSVYIKKIIEVKDSSSN